MTGRAEATLRYVAEDAPTGYGDAADRLVRALRSAGVGVEYRRWDGVATSQPTGMHPHRRDPSPETRARPGAPTIAHLVPEHYPVLRPILDDLPGGSGAFVAHTVWETDKAPAHWPELLNAVDRVLLPTAWNEQIFKRDGVAAPISVLPHVACDPTFGDGGAPLALPDDIVVFYTISRWDQRKQPGAVIRAFLRAFTAEDPVVLVVKTSPNVQHPAESPWGFRTPIAGTTMLEVARLVREADAPPAVRAEIGEWSPAAIAGLHTRGDCFVSLSHGEGWDVSAFDAAVHGNPVVATGWGGALAWLDPDASYLVDVDIEPVEHADYESYAPDQHWASPHLDHAAELLQEVAADLGAARRRARAQRDRLRSDFSPARVVTLLRERAPELDVPPPSQPSIAPALRGRRPRLAHFVFGLKNPPDPFHLVHALAIESCRRMVQPDEVHVHVRKPPSGPAWDRVAEGVVLHAVEWAAPVRRRRYSDMDVYRYAYAHHADFVRLDVLAQHGGLYADLDTLFISPLPDDLWAAPFAIGREADVANPDGGAPLPALSNAVMVSQPGSAFVEAWRAEIADALDGTWAAHSCFLANDLAERMSADVTIAPQRTFHGFEPTKDGIALLLEHPPPRDLDGVVALHLAAHLWWEELRTDFSDVHGEQINEEWIRTSPSTYATLARRFL